MRSFVVAVVLTALGGFAQTPDAGWDLDAGVPQAADAGPPLPAPRPPPTFVENTFHGTQLLTRSMHFEAAFVAGGGGLVHMAGVPTVPLTGIYVRERNGLLSLALTGILGNTLQAAGSVKIDNVRTNVSESTRTNSDGSRTQVTTTTTTATVTALKTQEQLEQEQADFRASAAGHTFLDLTVYADGLLGWQRGAVGGSGYELSVGGHGELFQLGELPVVLDLGFYLANVRIPAPAGSGINESTLYFAAGGILGRLYVPLTRFATLSVEVILNFLSFDYLRGDEALRAEGRVVSSPLKLGLELHATDHLFVRAQAILGGFGFTDGRLGGVLSAGLRL